MCNGESGCVGLWGLVAPVPPSGFQSDARREWEREYPAMLRAYYALVREFDCVHTRAGVYRLDSGVGDCSNGDGCPRVVGACVRGGCRKVGCVAGCSEVASGGDGRVGVDFGGVRACGIESGDVAGDSRTGGIGASGCSGLSLEWHSLGSGSPGNVQSSGSEVGDGKVGLEEVRGSGSDLSGEEFGGQVRERGTGLGPGESLKQDGSGASGRKEKNRRRRERRRMAKVGAADASCDDEVLPEWRRRDFREVRNIAKKKNDGFVGYFDGLSEDVKLELKESRARRLIAENKRKAAEDEQKEKVNGDPLIESLRAVMSVMRIEKQVGKLADDSVIGGWAKTVASAASKTTASEQGSGSLSLASIGSTPPVDAGGLPLSQREVAYREALVRLHDHYDRRAAFSDEEVKADIQEVREAYADVCYTPAQAEKRRLYKVAETLVLSMGGHPARQEGMLQLIEKLFEDGDEEDGRIPLDDNFSRLLGRSYL